MRLDFMILADAAQTGPSGKLYLMGGGITWINSPALPSRVPHLAVVVRIVGSYEELSKPHHSILRVLSPSGQQIGPALRNDFAATTRARAGEEQSVTLIADMILVPFAEEGVYRFELLVDDEVFASRDLLVGVGTPDTASTSPEP